MTWRPRALTISCGCVRRKVSENTSPERAGFERLQIFSSVGGVTMCSCGRGSPSTTLELLCGFRSGSKIVATPVYSSFLARLSFLRRAPRRLSPQPHAPPRSRRCWPQSTGTSTCRAKPRCSVIHDAGERKSGVVGNTCVSNGEEILPRLAICC